MKRLKLFLAAMAAMVSLGINAQSWTGNEVVAGDFYLYNIGSGKWLSSGNDWGTQASLVEAGGFLNTLELSDGKYAIKNTETRTNYTAGPGYLSGGYMDGESAAYFTFEVASRGDGVTAYYIKNGSDNLSYSGSGTTVVFNAETGDNAQWVLVSKADRLAAMAEADDSHPVDATFLLKNAEFGRYKLPAYDAAWTWTFPGSTNKNNAGDNTNFCVESYHVAFDFAQVVADAPKGYYAVRGQAFYRQDGSNNTDLPYFYVGDAQVTFPAKTGTENSMNDASNSFTAGNYQTSWSVKTTYAGGDLKVGTHLDNNTALWCIWDNIQIQYYGPIDLTEFKVALANAVAAAKAYESQLPAAVYANIASVITEKNIDYETGDEYSAAITAINNAVSTYATDAVVAAYSNYNSVKTAVLALDDDATVFTGSATVDVSAAETAVASATTVEAINAAIQQLRAAAATFLGAVNVKEDQYFDITSVFLKNADFSAGNINGWETNYVSGVQAINIGYQNNSSYTNEDVTINQFIEAWKNGATLGDGYLRQIVSGLPEGKYTLEADAIATWQNDDTRQITGAQLYITADGIDYKTDMSTKNGKPQHFSVEFMNSDLGGDVIFGLRTVSANCNWLCADNFKVKFYGIDLSAYETQLQNEVNAFDAVKASIESSVRASLQTQVTALDQEYTSSSAYVSAIANMQTINTYAAAYAAATAAHDNASYSNVTGSELTALTTAIADAPTYATYSTYAEKSSALTSATSAFITAKNSYDILATEIDKATALGVASATVNSYAATSSTTAATALTNTQNLKVAEYNLVNTNYAYSVELGTWTKTGSTGSLSSQHWSGETREYLEQSSANWAAGSWTIKYDQNVTLPAGNYVFKVAGRQADSDGVTLSLTVKNGDTVLGSVSDFPRGDRGLGITTSGATSFDPNDTFCNTRNNNGDNLQTNGGNGWEWRYVKFTLNDDATVNVAVDAVATIEHMWVSFCDATVQTDNEANISLIAYNIALGSAQTVIDDDDYENVTGSEKTALQAAIDADGSLDKTNASTIDAATTALDNARTTFTGAKSSYDALVAAKAVVYPALAYAATAKRTTLNNAQAATATSASDADTKTAAITTASRRYYESHALAEGVDGAEQITIEDPQFEGLTNSDIDAANWKIGDNWMLDGQNNGSISFYTENTLTDGDGNSSCQYLRIQKSDNNAGIHQTVNLAPGKYMMTVSARCQSGQGAKFEAFAGGVYVNIPQNNNTGGQFDKGWNDVSVEFNVTETANITFGVKSDWGKDIWWNVTRFRLVKLSDTYERAATSTGWGTICLPYAAIATNGTEVYEIASINSGKTELALTDPVTEMTAGKPYIYNKDGAATFEQIKINAAATPVAGANSLTGVFTSSAGSTPEDSYIMKNGNWYRVAGNTSVFNLGNNRAYIADLSAITVADPSGARVMKVFYDGETTGIDAIKAGESTLDLKNAYDLQGRKVQNLKRGLYIVNGKKVVVK